MLAFAAAVVFGFALILDWADANLGDAFTPQTLLLIDERDALLIKAARFFGAGLSDRELARQLRSALLQAPAVELPQ